MVELNVKTVDVTERRPEIDVEVVSEEDRERSKVRPDMADFENPGDFMDYLAEELMENPDLESYSISVPEPIVHRLIPADAPHLEDNKPRPWEGDIL